MSKATIQLSALTCPSCVLKIDNAVKAIPGVARDSVKVLFNASKVKFDFDEAVVSIAAVEKAITALGYEVLKSQVKA
ncbi:MAG: heavy-metal-associated domain-containing protein [Clostridiaceae bacterium]|jgi:copper chaperone CopZ|nr:heavy-metal-associated domain-containing protein [Clostridiaceae bacterium]